MRSASLFLIAMLTVLLSGCSGLFRFKPELQPVPPEPPHTAPELSKTSGIIVKTKDYVVLVSQRGDTLRSLAERFLGDAERDWVIADFNHLSQLVPGQEIVIPLTVQNPVGVYINGYQKVPILSYHRFGHEKNKMIISPAAFEAQMAYLKARSYRVIRLTDLIPFFYGQKPLPRRAVVITIDDGFKSAYTIAYPILKKYDFPATVFIYSDFIGAPLGLTWDEIQEMVNSRLIDVQPHSKTHVNLGLQESHEDHAAYGRRLTEELLSPSRQIKQRLHLPLHTFAYPYGATTDFVTAQTQKLHYRMGVTAERGGNAFFADPFLLRRTMVYGDASMEDFQKSLEVFADFSPVLRQLPVQPPHVKPNASASLPARLATRKSEAHRLMRQGDLAAALIQWQILLALDPDNREFRHQLEATQALIRQQADKHLRLGKQAVKRRDFKRAKQAFLTVMTLDPLRTQPRTHLRKIEQDRMRAIQQAKFDRLSAPQQVARTAHVHGNYQPPQSVKATPDQLEIGVARFRGGDLATSIQALRAVLTTNPEHATAKQYLAEAHFQLGQRLYRQGNVTEALPHFEAARETYPSKGPQINLYVQDIKQKLADRYYRKGLQNYRTDLDKAIQLWKVSLSYNPEHTKAQRRLENAYQLQKMRSQFGHH